MIQFDEEKENLKISELRQKEEEEFVRTAADNRGLKYFNLAQVPIDPDALKLVPEAEAREANAVPFQVLDRQVGVGVINPEDPKAAALMHALSEKGFTVSEFMVSRRSIERALSQYADISKAPETKIGSFDVSNDAITDLLGSMKHIGDIKSEIESLLAHKQKFQTTRVVEIILAGALAVDASDVHLEPEHDKVRLRYRLDGVLNDIEFFNPEVYAYILSRIKLISGLKLNVKTEAQDGRFSIMAKNAEIEVRTSVLPGSYGESIVLRILNPDAISVPMEELGFEPHLGALVEKEIAKPNGMILTTGPTGSGKTTTLYAFLKKVYTPDIKIITIEDPIEYHLEGIVQTQTDSNRGYTFNQGLRAALRQDPDVIMVGEIRDGETAETAVNASVTGHLVFSTLHTNNAAGTFPRLINLGINPKVISSSIAIALAQRLTRKLCTFCRKEIDLAGPDAVAVARILSTITLDEYKTLPHTKIWAAVGCEKCNNTGYKGRIGIYEGIRITKQIEAAVLENPSEREIQSAALDQGTLTMAQDGIVKVLKGITSIEELRRVIDIEENV